VLILKVLSPEIEARVRSLIDPATKHYLRRYTGFGCRCLEIGCGSGQYRFVVEGEYLGVDLGANDYKEGIPSSPDLLADAFHLPFRNESFDLIFYAAVVLYFAKASDAIREACRVLRGGGELLIFDYSWKTVERLRLSYVQKWSGVTAHPKKCREWTKLLQDAGLVNVNLSFRSAHVGPRLLECVLPRFIYFSWIDSREAPTVLVGQKPGAAS
jgi:SAM-dependent methyltransferase